MTGKYFFKSLTYSCFPCGVKIMAKEIQGQDGSLGFSEGYLEQCDIPVVFRLPTRS